MKKFDIDDVTLVINYDVHEDLFFLNIFFLLFIRFRLTEMFVFFAIGQLFKC